LKEKCVDDEESLKYFKDNKILMIKGYILEGCSYGLSKISL